MCDPWRDADAVKRDVAFFAQLILGQTQKHVGRPSRARDTRVGRQLGWRRFRWRCERYEIIGPVPQGFCLHCAVIR